MYVSGFGYGHPLHTLNLERHNTYCDAFQDIKGLMPSLAMFIPHQNIPYMEKKLQKCSNHSCDATNPTHLK